jgi:hypothetical protein
MSLRNDVIVFNDSDDEAVDDASSDVQWFDPDANRAIRLPRLFASSPPPLVRPINEVEVPPQMPARAGSREEGEAELLALQDRLLDEHDFVANVGELEADRSQQAYDMEAVQQTQPLVDALAALPTMPTMLEVEDVLPFILDIVPDVCPDYATKLIKDRVLLEPLTVEIAAARAIEMMFEDAPYPTAPKGQAKRKRTESFFGGRPESSNSSKKAREDDGQDGKIDYLSTTSATDRRLGAEYLKRAMRTLENTFPTLSLKV